MSDVITFVQLTDLHVSHPDSGDTSLLVDTVSVLESAVARIESMSPPPAFVVASGDLTNRGDVASYRLVSEMLGRLKMPVLLALGNHDKREAFGATVLGRSDNLSAPYFHDQAVAGVHVIVLDTLIPGKVGGTIEDRQFAFLGDALMRHANLPKVIVMHHPPALDSETPLGWESIDFISTERLAKAIAGYRVAAILSGHIHLNRVCHWHGVPVIIPTGHHNTVDPLYRDGLHLFEAAGFAVCTLRETGLTATMVALPTGSRELKIIPFQVLKSFT